MTPQQKNNPGKFFFGLMILCSCLAMHKAESQIVESTNHQAYEYLYRMAQKGIISIDDYILPLDRGTLLQLLDSVKAKYGSLTSVEKKELAFYSNDFLLDTATNESAKFLKAPYQRPRFFYASNKRSTLMIDPILGLSAATYSHKNNLTYYSGIHLYGRIGKHIGYNFQFRDITERGDTVNLSKALSPYKGRAGGISTNGMLTGNNINYAELNFNIGYKWKSGLVSIGKDNMVWGYGLSGNMVLSQKSPSYPYIRLDYYPFRWMHFNYMHGWLNSNIIDSNRTYGIGLNNNRILYVRKFIAHHSLNLIPANGWKISLGESFIYSDKFDIGYIMPINFFKAYDHYTSNTDIRAGGNGQFFAQVSSRNHIRNTHLYASLFIDEIRLSTVFSNRNRNQLGYTIGGSITDAVIKYLTLGAEYVHINPFVYSNLIAAQTYMQNSYSLGDWMGNNADRLYLFFRYTPLAKLKINAYYQYLRKGGPGTIEQQYDETKPQPPFLFDRQFDQQSIGVDVKYEWYQSLKFTLSIFNSKVNYSNGESSNAFNFMAGVSYGFWLCNSLIGKGYDF